MYRAVEDQLQLHPASSDTADTASHEQLRQAAVDRMRAHADDFLPFFAQVCRSLKPAPFTPSGAPLQVSAIAVWHAADQCCRELMEHDHR